MDAPDAALSYAINDTSARYVRLSITEMNAHSGKFSAALNEIEVYYDDGNTPAPAAPEAEPLDPYIEGENIAKAKPVIVSSTTPDATYEQWGWASKFLVDEDLSKGWTSNIKLHRAWSFTPPVPSRWIIRFSCRWMAGSGRRLPM